MFPTLKLGQHVVTFNWFLRLKVGNLVVAKVNSRLIIKRISKIKQHEYFLVGDNKKESTDSGHFGGVKMEQIIGKVL